MSSDDIPAIDGMTLEEFDRIRKAWGLDKKQSEALDLIRKGLPLQNFTELLGEELWLRELLKDLEGNPCRHCKKYSSGARTKALQMFAEWAGLLGSKSKKKSKKTVTFED